ncbi:AAA family ATPase [Deinococcus sp. YIM 134068]|uniref:AAA family ATPase n=1 Tax=Deinococcus lichenicola TaxID=3118910 RepID=UPI002F95D2E0
MKDRRAYHWLILGGTGSGKTFTARQIVRQYVRKPDFVVIVNSSSQLAEFARRRVVVDMSALDRDWTPRELAATIRQHGAVHFEVSPGADPKRLQAWMDALGNACMALGRLGTDRCHVLLIVDEAQNYLSQKVFARGMRRVFAEGRKFGVDCLAITQQLAGQGGDMIDMTVRRMVSVLVVCPMDEEAERQRVMRTWPELRDPGILAFPDPATGRPGEYMVRDRGSRRAVLVRVDSAGRRFAVPLSGSPSPPRAA